MNVKRTYPVWQRHEELRPVLSDLVFVTESVVRAQRDPRTTGGVVALLLAAREVVVRKFWQMLYAASEFTEDHVLRLDLSTAEPSVQVLSEPGSESREETIESSGFPFSSRFERRTGPGDFWLQ